MILNFDSTPFSYWNCLQLVLFWCGRTVYTFRYTYTFSAGVALFSFRLDSIEFTCWFFVFLQGAYIWGGIYVFVLRWLILCNRLFRPLDTRPRHQPINWEMSVYSSSNSTRRKRKKETIGIWNVMKVNFKVASSWRERERVILTSDRESWMPSFFWVVVHAAAVVVGDRL